MCVCVCVWWWWGGGIGIPPQSAVEYNYSLAGTSVLIRSHPSVVDLANVSDKEGRLCRKDTGKSKRMRRWSRGHQFIVRGGGHIDSWSPLYK